MSEKPIQVQLSILIPRVPTFLNTQEGKRVHIKDISDEGLVQVGVAWSEELVEKAQQARAAKTADVDVVDDDDDL